MSILRRIVPTLLACVAACDQPETAYGPPITRDSSGVTIVESTHPLWTVGTPWRLSNAPTLDIGVVEGEPEYELFGVNAALRLGDGRLAVVNRTEIRFFDASGAYLNTAGREGGGPGEFARVTWLQRFRGDSIVVYDRAQSRISVFDGSGRFGRTIALRHTSDVPRTVAVGVLESGAIVSRGQVGLASAEEEIEEGVSRDRADMLVHEPDGSIPRVVASFPGREQQYIEWNGGIAGGRPLFGHDAHFLTTATHVVVGISDEYELKIVRPTGETERLFRRAYDVRVTREDINVLRDARLEALEDPGTRREVERAYADLPTGAPFPAFGWPAPGLAGPTRALQVDAVGNLWVVDQNRPADTRNSWSVFNPNGEWLGTMVFPDGFWPMDIGDDYVLGRWRDDLDVTHVQLYELIKPDTVNNLTWSRLSTP